MPTSFVLCFLIGFLTGGVPFGYLVGRAILKDDIRNHGSGNIGATNVGRVLGWKYGIGVLLLDALKGFIPTWLVTSGRLGQFEAGQLMHAAVLTGVSTILGHMYPIYLKLRGGKGVATAVGVVLILSPTATLVAVTVFLLTLALFRTVAISSICAAVAFGTFQLWKLGAAALEPRWLSLTAFSVLVPLLIIWRHRSNILRLMNRNSSPGTPPSADSSAAKSTGDTTEDETPNDQ